MSQQPPELGPPTGQGRPVGNLEHVFPGMTSRSTQDSSSQPFVGTIRTFPRFLELPNELQLEVLRCLIPNRRTIHPHAHIRLHQSTVTDSLSANAYAT